MEIYKRSSPATGQGPYGVSKRFLTGLAKKDLIVVLACIVFLLANIAAIGPRGRRHAKQALCLSNLYRWGDVFETYAKNNHGSTITGPGVPGAECWPLTLRPYYKSKKLLLCPMAVNPFSWIGLTYFAWVIPAGSTEIPEWEDEDCIGSYGINDWCYNPPPEVVETWGEVTSWCWKSVNVKGAENIPLFLDCIHIGGFPRHTDLPPEAEDDISMWGHSQMTRYCINRHNAAINALFMDFSVRPVGLKELWTLKWHRKFRTDGRWTKAGGVTPDKWPEWMQDFQDY